MAIEDMFQPGTDKVLDDRATRPLMTPTPQRSFASNLFGTAAAPVKGIGAGATEVEAAGFDILSAYGKIAAVEAAVSDPSNLLDSKKAEADLASTAGLRNEIKTGAAFSTEIGTSFRQSAREYAPNPDQSNAAEDLLFGLSRFMTKAIGYTTMGGAVPGAVMLATDEGLTEADRLKAQGVDINTRTKVGVLAGGVAGASVLIPVAGKTLTQTAGLVAVGGPGGFIAQQAGTKAILEHAGYDKMADQYDPFDPVGLAVSTLVPAAFGGYAMRGARARPAPVADAAAARQLADMGGSERLALQHNDPRLDAYAVTAAQREGISPELLLAVKNAGERSNPTAVSPKGAKGVMQFMDGTWNEFGKGDPRDPAASIDAGARYLKHLVEHYNGNEKAALAHYNGGYKAGEAIVRGEPAPARETREYLERSEKYIAERAGEEAGRAAAQDPDMVAAARTQLARDTLEAANLRDPADPAGQQQHFETTMRAADMIAAGERVEVGPLVELAPGEQAKLLDNIAERIEAAREEAPIAERDSAPEALDPVAEAAGARSDLEQLGNLRQAMDDVETRTPKPPPDEHAKVKFDNPEAASKYIRENKLGKTHRTEMTGRDKYSIRPKKKDSADWRGKVADREAKLAEQLRVAEQNAAARKAAREAAAPKPAETVAETTAPKATAEAPAAPTQGAAPKAEANQLAASLEAQAAEIAKFSPDMMVQLEGMAGPMRLADALETIKAEAAKDAETAPLYEVAANCFLRTQ